MIRPSKATTRNGKLLSSHYVEGFQRSKTYKLNGYFANWNYTYSTNNRRADFWRTAYPRFIKPYISLGEFIRRLLEKYTYIVGVPKTSTTCLPRPFWNTGISNKIKTYFEKNKTLGLFRLYNVYENNISYIKFNTNQFKELIRFRLFFV